MNRSLALVLLVALAGCDKAEDGDAGLTQSPAKVFAQFDPVAASPSVPFPNDAFFAGFSDPTLNIPNAASVPFVTQANLLDGFSTTASAFADFIGFVDFTTAGQGVIVVDGSTGAPLVPGVDFTLQSSNVRAAPGVPNPALPLNAFRSRILIEPLKPLKPSTRYLVAITTGLRSVDGGETVPSELFRVARSATPVAEQNEPVLATLTPEQKARLETVRAQLVRPVVEAFIGAGIPETSLALAWSFTTQSTAKTLQRMNAAATARTLGLRNTGLTTGTASGGALPPVADVYAGTLQVPYYLANSGGDANSTAPLSAFWLADTARPDLAASFLGQVPCGAFASGATINGQTAQPSVSTTTCYPLPQQRTVETIPVLATIPNANSGRTMPAGGWPVVIFQHGITRNRTDMIALAPALAAAGFAVVAIDLPLHGLPPGSASRIPGVGERTFDLDLVGNTTGAPGPDGTADGSGTHFINLSSLITSRDNLRQAAADLVTLARSVDGGILLGTGGAPNGMSFDGTQIRYVGHSLGGIVGTVFLGVNAEVGAATLAMPGGGVAKLLDASDTFGPRIAAGLAASGVTEGTDNYETFLRFAQTLVDAGDPQNFAAAAAAAHPIHMIEVIADAVVPNEANATPQCATAAPPPADCVAALPPGTDYVQLTGYLSGTEPLAMTMGLGFVGPITPPVATPQLLLGAAARHNLVQFAIGEHGTILSPDDATVPGADANLLPVTAEMQRQTANFLASNGACLPIGRSCS